jgi:hypothetical protein
MYEYGEGTRQDRNKAKELYGKSCDLQYQEGCDEFAKMNQKKVK